MDRFSQAVRLGDLASFCFLRGYLETAALLKQRSADFIEDPKSKAFVLECAYEWAWLASERKKKPMKVH